MLQGKTVLNITYDSITNTIVSKKSNYSPSNIVQASEMYLVQAQRIIPNALVGIYIVMCTAFNYNVHLKLDDDLR